MIRDHLSPMILANTSVLTYSVQGESDINGFHMGIFLSNPDLPFVPMSLDYFDSQPTLLYNIDALSPLDDLLSRDAIKPAQLFQVIQSLIEDLTTLDNYHMSLEVLSFDPGLCYIDLTTNRCKWLYLPQSLRPLAIQNVKILMKAILPALIKTDTPLHLKPLLQLMQFTYSDLELSKEVKTQAHELLQLSKTLQPSRLQAPGLEPSPLVPIDGISSPHTLKSTASVPRVTLTTSERAQTPLGQETVEALPTGAKVLKKTLFQRVLNLFPHKKDKTEKKRPQNPRISQEPRAPETKLEKPCLPLSPFALQGDLERGGLSTSTTTDSRIYREWDYADEDGVLKKNLPVERTAFQTVLLQEKVCQCHKLFIRHGGTQFVKEFKEEKLSIGRNPTTSDIVLDDPLTGRLHAEIFQTEDHLYIKDLNSLNGTLVNQVRIVPNHYFELKQGDEITIGRGGIIIL